MGTSKSIYSPIVKVIRNLKYGFPQASWIDSETWLWKVIRISVRDIVIVIVELWHGFRVFWWQQNILRFSDDYIVFICMSQQERNHNSMERGIYLAMYFAVVLVIYLISPPGQFPLLLWEFRFLISKVGSFLIRLPLIFFLCHHVSDSDTTDESSKLRFMHSILYIFFYFLFPKRSFIPGFCVASMPT